MQTKTSTCTECIQHGFPTFVWEGAKPVIGCWFAQCMWQNNSKWYTCAL